MAEHDKVSFNAGYMLAVANIVHLHGEDTVARDVLGELGATSKDIAAALDGNDYDGPIVRKLQREIVARARYDRDRILKKIVQVPA